MSKISLAYTHDVAYQHVKSLFEEACGMTPSRFSDKALSLSREGRDLELGRLEILPSDYSNVDDFRNDYLISKFLSKWKGLKTGLDTEAAALFAFEKQEVVCKVSNQRLRSHNTAFVEPIFHRAQTLIARVLGPFDLKRLEGLERWGPGATTDMSRSQAYLDEKITNFPVPVTRGAVSHLARCIQDDLHWSYCLLGDFPVGPYSILPCCFTLVEGSNITTVPKNSKTDRTIAIEPRGNMFLQKSVGSLIRRLLKRVGVDLDNQCLNQQLAASCERDGLATIDLSMASDSISRELIYQLLPLDWALYLDQLRSPKYLLKGAKDYVAFQKFSSMGNGFTFELESLLFWGLTKASLESEDSVIAIYGDDIILPQRDAAVLISTLSYAGFEINAEKSFISGSFFESCGKHYFQGVDVTPVYQKEIVDSEIEHIRMLNRVARFLIRSADEDALRGPWVKPWRRALRPCLAAGAPTIPFGIEGDDGYLVNHTMFQPSRWKRSYGNQWRVLRTRPIRYPANDAALLAYTLRQGTVTESPYEGSLIARQQRGRVSITTRWIEPPWEFALA